jgi:hypothetical protein
MSDIANTFAAEAGVSVDSINQGVQVANATEGLKPLTGNDSKLKAGSFVLSGQTLASEQGFRNVSKLWFDKTLTFEQGLERLDDDKAKTHDISATVDEMVPTVDALGNFALLHKPTETYYQPTPHAVKQMGHWADTGTWYVENMLVNPKDLKGRDKYARDREDSETLAKVFRNGFRRLDQSKKFFFRTREDGTLRAMLTDRFAVIDNRWFVEKLKEFIPGGRLSHWRGDGDTLYGNVLIPDTIRQEKDSEYGGMLSIGNSEIGERRVSSVPSIFRAICMNGCIWGQTKGKGIRQVHRGKINLDHLALEIKENLNRQIPLLPQGIDRLLGLRSYAWDGASAKVVIAAVADNFRLSKRQASAVLNGWNIEEQLTPELSKTLFGVTNAITRAGQTLDNSDWVKFDEMAGELTEWDGDDFGKLVANAKSLKVDEVEEMYA